MTRELAACERLELPEGTGLVRVWRAWLSPLDASRLQQELMQALDWQQGSIRIFGKDVLEPRLSVWMGDANAHYRYGGRMHAPTPWLPSLAALRDDLMGSLGVAFNSVLANLYRDQRDSMGWHADNEKELGDEPCIASISLGQTRRFVLRHARHAREVFHLGPGSLLVMSGRLQEEWRHSVPKESRVHDARINLTFRQIAAP